MLSNVKRDTKQIFLFLIFLLYEFLVFNTPGYMTLIVLVLEQIYDYINQLFKINFLNLVEYFTYFVLFFFFTNSIGTYNFFINFILSILLIFGYIFKRYGFTKIFRN